MEERQVAGSIRPFSRRGLHGLRRGLHGLRRGLHGLQARITRITGADYADYITPIMKLIYALKLSGMHVVVRNSL